MRGADLADVLAEISWRMRGRAAHLKQQDEDDPETLILDVVAYGFIVAAELVDEIWGEIEVPER